MWVWGFLPMNSWSATELVCAERYRNFLDVGVLTIGKVKKRKVAAK